MIEQRVQRRLAAILATDVVGYSRLMVADEAGTVAALKAHRRELFTPKTAEHGGRIVKLMGDGALAEFASVVDAVECAVALQRGMRERNADIPEDRQIVFRIGINLGDIIIDGDDIYGDGVNVAARLESLAEPGGICVSGTVFNHVKGKVELGFEDLGEHEIKNIAEPVRVFSINLEAAGTARHEGAEVSSLDLSDKPSIAVLPFENMSRDPEQEYFADGIAEDLITALSRFRWFFVIARNSSFTYKGQSPDVRKVSKELGVRYVLEGSVRKAANRIRISAQLVEGATGNHIWAQNYDRNLDDVFAVQDEITGKVVGAIEPELGKAERMRRRAQRPDSLDAWDLYHRGTAYMYRRTKKDMAEAIRLYVKAIESDPNFAQAHAARAIAHYANVVYGFSNAIEDDRVTAMRSARTAVDLDDDDPTAYTALGMAHLVTADYKAAASASERAVDLNPGSAVAHSILGLALSSLGRFDEAIAHDRLAVEVGVRDPALPIFMGRLGYCCLRAGRLEDALHWSEQSIQHSGNVWPPYAQLAWVYMQLGRRDDARAVVDRMRSINPDLGAAYIQEIMSVWEPDPDEARRRVDDLRAVGLRE